VPAGNFTLGSTGETALQPALVALGRAVRALRELRGMSQEALALDAGVQRKTLWQLETGKCKTGACYSTLHRVCGGLDVTLAELTTLAQLLNAWSSSLQRLGSSGLG
jgi:transcriptional regulator with XRE-family HTH domain